MEGYQKRQNPPAALVTRPGQKASKRRPLLWRRGLWEGARLRRRHLSIALQLSVIADGAHAVLLQGWRPFCCCRRLFSSLRRPQR